MSTSNDVEDDGATADPTAPGSGRRRRGNHRAVSRPAGPPAGAPAAVPQAQPAAPDTAETGDGRSRGAAALPLFQAATPAVTDPQPSSDAPGVSASAQPAAEPAAEAPSRPRRRRAASRPAGPPVDAPPQDSAPAPQRDADPAPRQDAAARQDGAPPQDSAPQRGGVREPRGARTRQAAPAPEAAPEPQDAPPAQAEPEPRTRAAREPVARRGGRRSSGAPVATRADGAVLAIGVDADSTPTGSTSTSSAPAAEDLEDLDDLDVLAEDEPTTDGPLDADAGPADGADPAVDEADPAEDEDDDADSDEDAPEEGAARGRRGRRRRGGRGRRRRADGEDDETAAEGSSDEDDAPVEADDESAAPGAERSARAADGAGDAGGVTDGDASDDDSDDEAEDSDEGAGGSSRRRRRRRRRGAGGTDADEEAGEPEAPAASSRRARSRRSSSSSAPREGSDSGDVTALKGSTRLEAKRQRRRDGRDGGRRPRVLSEAEFLARRESVERTMVVRTAGGRSQVAVLEDGVLVEHYAARKQQTSMIGNVHLGRVQNVLPSMEAAFVDIGRGRNAVLYAGEVDWEAAGLTGQAKKIESALKSGDPVLVQVTKDPVGHKGARLTSQVSLPGRYLVYVPGGTMTGISRKLPDVERSRLKSILKEVVPEEAGVIVRTAAEGASEAELRRDVERLTAQWEEISARAGQVSPPTLLHGEPDLVIKVVRDVFNEDFARLVVEGDEAWESIEPYVASVAPDLAERVSRWEDGDAAGAAGGAFVHFRIDEQIAKALERKVWLPSGGSLVIDRTEAMTVVDVNTGRFTGSGGNLEETVTRNNLEAAEEIVRQLRLRDIGGIVVVDFIDMVLESNRDLVVRRLVECLGRDRSKHQVAEVTSLGLVQMTRKRVGQGLLETFSEPCEHCAGRGVVVQDDLAAVGGANGGHSHGGAQHGGSGSGSGGRGARGEQRSEPRPEPREQARDSDRQPERSSGRDAARSAGRDKAPEQPREGGRDQGRAPAAERSAPEEPRSREEAARDAVREAMNGIALATLRPGRHDDDAPEVPSLDAAALLAAFGAPAADDGGAGGTSVVEVVETSEVVTTVVPASAQEPEPSALPALTVVEPVEPVEPVEQALEETSEQHSEQHSEQPGDLPGDRPVE